MEHKLNLRFFYALLFGLFAATFVSCSDDDEPSIDLRNLCQSIPDDKVTIYLNGEVVEQPGKAIFAFPDSQSPEEEVFESEMLLETEGLWPGNSYGKIAETFIFKVDAKSSPNRIEFNGKVQRPELHDYDLDLEGYYENEELVLNLNYRSRTTALTGNTYELDMTADDLLLFDGAAPASIEWNGEQIPTKDFLHESLRHMFNYYVDQAGNDAARITFLEDGSMEVSLRDARTHTFAPAFEDCAYRFDRGLGWLECKQEDANNFSKDFMPFPWETPNGLFFCTRKDKAYIPVRYQTNGDILWMALHLNEADSIVAILLNYWTASVTDNSDETNRLREISNLLYARKITGFIWLNWKKV